MRRKLLALGAVVALVALPFAAAAVYRVLTAFPHRVRIASGPEGGRYRVIAERLKKWNVIGPEKRPPDRAYAETRATDPEGNNYDLAVAGFERDKSKSKKDNEMA